MLITLLYLQSMMALAFAIYLVYIMWGERLGIHNKKINFKKYLFMITIWALYSRTPWLSAIGVASDTPISAYKVILFYLRTNRTTEFPSLLVSSGFPVRQ